MRLCAQDHNSKNNKQYVTARNTEFRNPHTMLLWNLCSVGKKKKNLLDNYLAYITQINSNVDVTYM